MPDNHAKHNRCVPKWINESFFQKILTKNMPHFGKIQKLVLIPATPSNDRSNTIMLRVRLEIELDDGYTQRKSYIMKTMLDGDGNNIANTLNLFPKERLMYESILPQMEKLYAEHGYQVEFAPACQWIDDIDGCIAIVLEDLQTRKYRNVHRIGGFDLDHMKRVLEKLAEFHAASVVLRERLGSLPKPFHNTFLPANYSKSKSYKARVASYKAAIPSWGLDDYKHYVNCIPDAEQYINAKMHCFRGDPNEFKVLIHGDFWSNNIMLNYTHNHKVSMNGFLAGSRINQIRFVDYQMCKWATPAIDLWQLIVCSVELKGRARFFDYYLYTYHSHLVKSLKLLQSETKAPTLDDLTHSMMRHGFWGYFATFNHLVLISLPIQLKIDITKILQPGEEGDRIRMKVFTNPTYVRAVKELLPFFRSRGILNFRNQ